MNDVTENTVVPAEESSKGGSSNIIAVGIGVAVLAVGAGIGFFFGNKRGNTAGEEKAKGTMQPEMDRLKEVSEALKAELAGKKTS